jgi:hypothetical protein
MVDGNGEPASDDEEYQAYVESFADDLVVDDIKTLLLMMLALSMRALSEK